MTAGDLRSIERVRVFHELVPAYIFNRINRLVTFWNMPARATRISCNRFGIYVSLHALRWSFQVPDEAYFDFGAYADTQQVARIEWWVRIAAADIIARMIHDLREFEGLHGTSRKGTP